MVKRNIEHEPTVFDGRNMSVSEEESVRPEYQWYQHDNLSEEEIATTLSTYERCAAHYSQLEWDDASIEITLANVLAKIRKQIERIPKTETPVAVVAGAGSFKDLLTLALMQYKIQVYGFDITPELLRIGQQKLTWNHVVAYAAKLGELDPSLNAWIAEIIKLVAQAESLTDKDFTDWLKSNLEENFQKKIHIFQGDLRNQYFRSNSVDKVIAVACFQHLQDLLPVLLQFFTILKNDNGSFYFNLRLDSERTATEKSTKEILKGRVFRDSVLTTQDSEESGDRYYKTYTMSEFQLLMETAIAEYQKLDPHSIITYDKPDVSGHPDHSKPPFINVFVTKRPKN